MQAHRQGPRGSQGGRRRPLHRRIGGRARGVDERRLCRPRRGGERCQLVDQLQQLLLQGWIVRLCTAIEPEGVQGVRPAHRALLVPHGDGSWCCVGLVGTQANLVTSCTICALITSWVVEGICGLEACKQQGSAGIVIT
jgi:hypothetical protein